MTPRCPTTQLLAVAALLAAAGCSSTPETIRGLVQTPGTTASTTIPMTIEGDQIVIPVEVERPDGSSRTVLANVNMGLAPPFLQKHLYTELGIDRGRDLSMRIGGMPVVVRSRLVTSIDDNPAPERQAGTFFFPSKVEASVQAGILSQFEVVLDYHARTLTLARPGTLHPEGVAVPIHVNDNTGLAAVDAVVDGHPYPMVIDCGSGYTWARGRTVAAWLRAHPDWLRADGAVGASNYNMVDYAFEKEGKVLQIPAMSFGQLHLRNVGVMGTGPVLGWPGDAVLGEIVWNSWQEGAPGGHAVAWIGANVLRRYRLTVDYAGHTSYWLKTSDFDQDELSQVGVTLVYRSGKYFIGRIVKKDGNFTVEGLEPNDGILSIDGQKVYGWPRDRVFAALHGRSGDHHILTIERDGRSFDLPVPVTSF